MFGPPIPGSPWTPPFPPDPRRLHRPGGAPNPNALVPPGQRPALAPFQAADDPDVHPRVRRSTQQVATALNALYRRGDLLGSGDDWRLRASTVTGGGALDGTTATTLTGILRGTGTALSTVGIGSGLTFTGGTLSATGGGGGSSYYTAPALADFTFVNQGTATATTPATSGGIWLTKPTQGGSSNITQLVRNIPGATWTMVWGYRPACGWGLNTSGGVGPSLYDSGTGKIVLVLYGGHHSSVAGGTPLIVANFTNATTGSSVPFGPFAVGEHRGGGGGYFCKIVNDGTDLRFSYGPDLDVWVEFHVQAVGSFITPDKVGFHMDAFDDTAGAQLYHHSLTSP